MTPKDRQKIKKKSKLNIAYLVLTTLSWFSFIYIFFFIDPDIWVDIFYIPFFASILLCIFFTLCLLVRRRIVNLLIALGFTAILFLRSLSFREIYFPILVILIVLTMIYFFTTDNSDDKLTSNANQQEKS